MSWQKVYLTHLVVGQEIPAVFVRVVCPSVLLPVSKDGGLNGDHLNIVALICGC
jgi:hypothetical protein